MPELPDVERFKKYLDVSSPPLLVLHFGMTGYLTGYLTLAKTANRPSTHASCSTLPTSIGWLTSVSASSAW
jgi:hypothetical protein